VLVYYDYLLTLQREIEFLWPPHNKLGWFTTACLFNRYVPVLGNLPIVISWFIKVDFPVRPSAAGVSYLSLTYSSCTLKLYARPGQRMLIQSQLRGSTYIP
jgi:Family of unknown function (DUF6533)